MAEEKTLSEILEERRIQYGHKVVSTLNKVYGSRNLNLIEVFEEVVSKLDERVSSGSLEGVLEEIPAEKPSEDKKQSLGFTFDWYAEERNAGLTHKQIKEKYSSHVDTLRNNVNQILGAYSANYSRWKAPKSSQGEDSKNAFTFDLFLQERQAGLSSEQIAEKYKLSGDDLMKYAEQYTEFRKSKARELDKGALDGDKRKRLTSYQYAKCRKSGMTNEEIMSKFRVDSPQQLEEFTAEYNQGKK